MNAYKKKYNFILLAIIIFLFHVVSGCGKYNDNDKDVAVVAKVGDYKILKSDFLKRKEQMSDFLVSTEKFNNKYVIDILVDDTLLLMEAEKNGINTNKEFLSNIEQFWRQSLIQELLKIKTLEISKNTKISEDEVKQYYNALNNEYFMRIITFRNKPDTKIDSLDKLNEYLIANKNLILDDSDWFITDITGLSFPIRNYLTLNDVVLNKPLYIYTDEHTIFIVKDKKKITIESINELKDEIINNLKNEKEQRAIKEWMQSLKNNVKISVNEDIL